MGETRAATCHRRRGAAALWVILAGPALLGMLILVIELAHIWLARVELENALGATALAAVKEWGDNPGNNTACPRNVGIVYAAGNTIVGVPLALAPNFDNGKVNDNDTCTGNLIFGAIVNQNAPFRFEASTTPDCSGGASTDFAVRAQATVAVKSLFCELAGVPLGPFSITAHETAFYDCAQQRPRLIRIEPGNFICP